MIEELFYNQSSISMANGNTVRCHARCWTEKHIAAQGQIQSGGYGASECLPPDKGSGYVQLLQMTQSSRSGSKAPFFTLAKRFLRPELVVRLCQYFKASHSARSGFDRAASAGRSVNCAAVENTRERIRTVTTRPVMPEAARIIATTMN
jgi:hypothetical protein